MSAYFGCKAALLQVDSTMLVALMLVLILFLSGCGPGPTTWK